MARLENWRTVGLVSAEAVALMAQGVAPPITLVVTRLSGTVYRHRCFQDGEWITTGKLVEFDPAAGVARTKNTRYELGVHAPEAWE